MIATIQTFVRTLRNHKPGLGRAGAISLSLATLIVLAVPAPTRAQSVHPDTLLAHVRYLASDALQGREAGYPGADSAAVYIEGRFRAYGLDTLLKTGWLQPFEVTPSVTIDPSSRLVLRSPRGTKVLKLYEEWLPFNFSGAGSSSGQVFQADYGLSDDSYVGLEAAEAQIVLVRGGMPEGSSPHGSGMDPSPRRKATLARDEGAQAVLITVPRLEEPRPGEEPHAVGIPAAQILETEDILAWLDEPDLQVTLEAKVEPVRRSTYNVVGHLAGGGDSGDEVLVLGAHYDHLGLGGPGSLAPDAEEPHNGADDNASGTAVLLGVAKYFAEHPEARPARDLVFVAFSAEEMGLLGSDYFVDHAPLPLERITAMINFDMVGRLQDHEVQVFGTETAQEFPALLDSLDAASPLELSYVGDGYGPSDQTSFYAKGIPVLHLFTGTHSQYHHPDDDWQLINAEGMAEITDFAIELARRLGNWEGDLELVEQERPMASGGGGYGPYLGTVPDFGEVEGGGLRLSGVRAGSPADEAGLQGGDVVVEFGGREVRDIYDYTYALRDHAPGDTVTIRVRRDGETKTLTAVLGRRR